MEINKAQVKSLIDVLGLTKTENILGKKEVANIMIGIVITKPPIVYDENKIYIWLDKNSMNKHSVYKLHCLTTTSMGVGQTEQFAFVDLATSNCYAKGQGSVEEQLKCAGENLLVFDTFFSFINWFNKNVKE